MSRTQILLIEGEGALAGEVQSQLERMAYRVTAMGSAEEAIREITELKPDVVLMDIRVLKPGKDLARLIRERWNAPIVFLSGASDGTNWEQIKGAEPYGYLAPPIRALELHGTLQIAQYRHRLEQERLKLLNLERDTIQAAISRIIQVLEELLSSTSPQSVTEGHKLRQYLRQLATGLKVTEDRDLQIAAMLCDIGYLYVPPMLILKVRAGLTLTPTERFTFNRVPEFGARILNSVPPLKRVAEIIYYQRKNFDGTGFPSVIIAGRDIPLGARMLRVVRDYYQLEMLGHGRTRIADQLTRNYGQYDPTLLRKTIEVLVNSPPPGSRPVELKGLGVGDLLAAPIETPEGTILVGSGTRISPALLEKVLHFAEKGSVREPVYVAQ